MVDDNWQYDKGRHEATITRKYFSQIRAMDDGQLLAFMQKLLAGTGINDTLNYIEETCEDTFQDVT